MDCAKALVPIGSAVLVGKPDDAMAWEELSRLILGLLMALAFAFVAGVVLRVNVAALRRSAAAPARGRVRKLNAAVRWAQATPLRIVFPAMKCTAKLEILSAAAFFKVHEGGVDTGRALRGAAFLRMGTRGFGSIAPMRRRPVLPPVGVAARCVLDGDEKNMHQ